MWIYCVPKAKGQWWCHDPMKNATLSLSLSHTHTQLYINNYYLLKLYYAWSFNDLILRNYIDCISKCMCYTVGPCNTIKWLHLCTFLTYTYNKLTSVSIKYVETKLYRPTHLAPLSWWTRTTLKKTERQRKERDTKYYGQLWLKVSCH